MATFTDMRALAERLRKERKYAEAVLAIASGLHHHAGNWMLNDIGNFAAMLSNVLPEAEAYYRGDALEENAFEAELWVRQVAQAKVELENTPVERRGGRVYAGMLDGLEGILKANLESLRAWQEGKAHYGARELDRAAASLRRSRRPEAADLLRAVERDAAEADRLHREAVARVWERKFIEAQDIEAASHRLFVRAGQQQAFEALCAQVWEADGLVREGRRRLGLYRETGDGESLTGAADAVARACDMLRSLGADASEMLQDAGDLDQAVRLARAERAYRRYEGARRDRDLARALEALEAIAELGVAFRDAADRLAEVRRIRESLARSAREAEGLLDAGDLDTAARVVNEALAGDFDTRELLDLRKAVEDRRREACEAYEAGQRLLAGSPRPVEEALTHLRRAAALFAKHPDYARAFADLEAEVRDLDARYRAAEKAAAQGRLEAAQEGFQGIVDAGVAFRDCAERVQAIEETLEVQIPAAQEAMAQRPVDYEAALRIAQGVLLRYPEYRPAREIEAEARRRKGIAGGLAEARRLLSVRDGDPALVAAALDGVLGVDGDNAEALSLGSEAVSGWVARAEALAGEGRPRLALKILEGAYRALSASAALRGLAPPLAEATAVPRRQVAEARDALAEGRALVARRTFGKARSAFERALRMDADLEEAHEALVALPGQIAGWKAFREGEVAEKEKDFERAYERYLAALKAWPGDAEIQAARSRVVAEMGLRESFRLVGGGQRLCTVLVGDRFDVGRNHPTGRINQIVFQSAGISRAYGTVYRGADGRWVIEDTSYKATDVNGVPAERHTLRDGDRLAIWPRSRGPRPIVEVEVVTCGDGAGMSAALFCREVPTAPVSGRGFQFLDGPELTGTYVLAGERVPVGGGADALVRVAGAPARCADILWDGTCVQVRDAGEGLLRVNGRPVTDACPLRDNDRVTFGEAEFRVEAILS